MEKNIFIFNKNQCVGCQACVVACINENKSQQAGHWKKVYSSNTNHYPDLTLFYLSLSCNHCDDAPCLYNCPAQAYFRNESTGAVLHDAGKCIGCRLCTWACPFDAPVFNSRSGIVEKCTFCSTRIEQGRSPACATHCPTGALDFEKQAFTRLEARDSSPVPVSVGSSLRVQELLKPEGPFMDRNLFHGNPDSEKANRAPSRISAKKEWPLLVFTLLCSFMVGFYAHESDAMTINAWRWLIPGSGAVAAIISILHLGKKFRLGRSLLNVQHSWLSREIHFFLLFYVTAFLDLFILPIPKLIPLISGLLLLISIDSLYRLAFWNWKIKIHSAQTLFSSFSLFLLSGGHLAWLLGVSALRIALYLYRKPEYSHLNLLHASMAVCRVLFLILSVGILYYTANIWLSTLIFLAGEIIDRIEFYNELSLPDPLPGNKDSIIFTN